MRRRGSLDPWSWLPKPRGRVGCSRAPLTVSPQTTGPLPHWPPSRQPYVGINLPILELHGKEGQEERRRRLKRPSSRPSRQPRNGEPLSGKDYERELKKLHVELVKLQAWVQKKGLKVCIVFEGRDGAGKGGTIKAITERVSPRVFRVIALPAPTEREKSQMYAQRYLPHLPAAGEVVIFDRSWYNRAGVERVMGFCSRARRRVSSSRAFPPLSAPWSTPASSSSSTGSK